MKYLFTLFFVYFVLIASDLFFLRMFPHLIISSSLMFLLASAAVVPQKTRFVYRALFPVIIICGFVADILSSSGRGIVFATYVLMALIVVLTIKNLPQGGNIHIFVSLFFVLTLIYRMAMSFMGGFNGLNLSRHFLFALISSLFCSIGAIIILGLINTRRFEKISKLLFRED